MKLVDHHRPLQQRHQRQPQVEPRQRQPRALAVQQFEPHEVQVGGHRAGQTLDPEGAAAMGICERDDLALAGGGVDDGDDAAHQHDDEQQQHADGDTEPFGNLAQDPHQKACPIPI